MPVVKLSHAHELFLGGRGVVSTEEVGGIEHVLKSLDDALLVDGDRVGLHPKLAYDPPKSLEDLLRLGLQRLASKRIEKHPITTEDYNLVARVATFSVAHPAKDPRAFLASRFARLPNLALQHLLARARPEAQASAPPLTPRGLKKQGRVRHGVRNGGGKVAPSRMGGKRGLWETCVWELCVGVVCGSCVWDLCVRLVCETCVWDLRVRLVCGTCVCGTCVCETCVWDLCV